MISRPQTDALRGSLDLLVLKTLSLQPMHGWGISQRVQQISDGVLEVNQGSLYPALQRLEKEGLISSDWGTTDNNRQARYYRLSAAGRRALGAEDGRGLHEGRNRIRPGIPLQMQIPDGVLDTAVVGRVGGQLLPFGDGGVVLSAGSQQLGLLKNFATVGSQKKTSNNKNRETLTVPTGFVHKMPELL